MIKQFAFVLSVGVAAAFSSSSADAFFGNRLQHRGSGCGSGYHGGGYYSAPTYNAGYSPYAYQAAYGRSAYRPSNTYSRNYGNANRGYLGYGFSGLMGYGNGYYYGGFPTTRASGIGLRPSVGYGW